MKKFITMLVLSLCMAISAGAQEFVAPTRSSVVFTDTLTTYTYKKTNKTYVVYKSKSNAYYIWKLSKRTNKLYKMYLPKEVQIKMGRQYND